MHEAEADAHGVRYLYRPVDLDALNLTAHPHRRFWMRRHCSALNAFNITHPCKQSVMEHLTNFRMAARPWARSIAW